MLYTRLACVLFCAVIVAASPNRLPSFKEYVAKFHKDYVVGSAEWLEHEAIYERELKRVAQHNQLYDSHKVSYFLEMNQFSDLTDSEKSAYFGYSGAEHAGSAKPSRIHIPGEIDIELPASVNWVDAGIVTPVKNQGQCGSCWAFATTEMAESYLARDTGYLTELAVEQVVDCVQNPDQCGGSGGCAGATVNLGFEYLMTVGFITEWAYPYLQYWNSKTGATYACQYDTLVGYSSSVVMARLDGYVKVQNNSYEAMMEATAQGPVAISVDASTWHAYAGGVYDGCSTENIDLNHAVQLVGYGTDPESGLDYWLVRNSWGPYWGEDGFIRLRRYNPSKGETVPCGYDTTPTDGTECAGGADTIFVCGTCGMLWDASYPTTVRRA